MDNQLVVSGKLLAQVSLALLLQRKRCFIDDACQAVAGMLPWIEVTGVEHIPSKAACLVVCNHYSRLGLSAWWPALALSTRMADFREPGTCREFHWVMTAAWTFPGSYLKKQLFTPITRWLFKRIAYVYDFIPMPAMPPDPNEVNDRAVAVMNSLRMARLLVKSGGILALAPEGRDFTDGLGTPPDGAGEYIALLVKTGLLGIPVGVGQKGGLLRICFGKPFSIEEIQQWQGNFVSAKQRHVRDRLIIERVMGEIAALLP